MPLDNLLTTKYQSRLNTTIDNLLREKKPLAREAKYYIESCRQESKSPRTIELYGMVLSEFLSFNNVERPNANDIRQFLITLQDRKLKATTVHIYHRSLKTFFSWLVREEIWTRSPMINVLPPKLPRTIIKPFSLDDIKRMLVVCGGNRFVDVRNRAIILVFLDTGLRLMEIANLRLSDFDKVTGIFRATGKGQKERVVRIGDKTQRALSRYFYMRTDDYDALWLSEERKPLTKSGLQVAMRRIARLAGITDARHGVHTFRHTTAITWLRNKGDLFTLQELLGHSSLEMVKRYTSALNSDDMVRVHKLVSPVDNLKI